MGQDRWEEIDFAAPTTAGINFGWNPCEGTHGFAAPAEIHCQRGNVAGYMFPVLEHPRREWHSITGGYVYRGASAPALYGHYIYGDYAGPERIRAWDRVTVDAAGLGLPVSIARLGNLTSFGEDEAGELYLVSASDGIFILTSAR